MRRNQYTNNIQRHTQDFKKWFLIRALDGLQDRARLTMTACRGLPHNILDAIRDEASKIGNVEIQDWLIKLGIRAENPTQDLLMLTVRDCLCKQVNQCLAYFSSMFIQSPVCWGQIISCNTIHRQGITIHRPAACLAYLTTALNPIP